VHDTPDVVLLLIFVADTIAHEQGPGPPQGASIWQAELTPRGESSLVRGAN
jgi:hypothetical protein